MWPAYLVLVLSLGPVLPVYLRIRNDLTTRRQVEFQNAIQGVKSRTDLQFTYFLALLHGMRGLFAASESVTPAEFNQYLSSLDIRTAQPANTPQAVGLRDLGFAQRVQSHERENHRMLLRGYGYPDYEPLFLGPGPDHFPVVYLDSFGEEGMRPSGWDPSGDPVRRSAMDQARDSGEAAATAPTEVHAVDPRRRTFGFVLYYPVYRSAKTPDTVEARRSQLSGFVFGSFEAQAFWSTIEGPGNPVLSLQVYDGAALLPERRVYAGPQAANGRAAAFLDGYTASGLGRVWSFCYASHADFERTPEAAIPRAILAGGLLLSLSLCGVTWMLIRARIQAEALHADLARSEAERLRASKLESVGLLAGGIAHDFNNILTSIVGNLGLARLAKPIDPDQAESLAEAERAALRARDLTQQLLTFSKGGAPIRRAASLADIIRESTQFALRGSNVRCEFELPANLWPVEVDVGQLNQVIHNLALNAQHAMPSGGCLRIRASNVPPDQAPPPPLRPGPYLHCSVQDTGTGISPEHLPKIFDPYFTTKQRGSGLGLATTYAILHKHDGLITVESALGRGTTFHLWLPASPNAQPAAPVDSLEVPQGRGRILIVDDEPAIRTVLSRSLCRLGYDPAAAAGAEEALQLLRVALREQRPFHAAILDLTIPGGPSGEEILHQLRQLDPTLKAIVSSGYSNAPTMANHRSSGFDAVLVKPYPADELARVLQQTLAAHPPSPEIPASDR